MNAQQRAKRRRALRGLLQFQFKAVMECIDANERIIPNLPSDMAKAMREYNDLMGKEGK